MAHLIKKQHLDPDLIAALTGSGTGSGISIDDALKEYRKKSEAIIYTDLGNSVLNAFCSVEDKNQMQTDIAACYKPNGTKISTNDIDQTFVQSVSQNTNNIAAITSDLDTIKQGTVTTTTLNDYATIKFVNDKLTDITNLANTADTNANDAETKITTINSSIDTIQANIANLTTGVADCRKNTTDSPIQYAELADVIQKDITDTKALATTLNENTFKKTAGTTDGCVLYSNSNTGYQLSDTIVLDNFVYTDNQLSYAIKQQLFSIIDLKNLIVYTSKYDAWNYNAVLNHSILNGANVTVADGYQRKTIDNTMYAVTGTAVTADASHITLACPSNATVPLVFTLGFYGSAFKLNGKQKTTQDAAGSTITISIDNTHEYQITSDYVASNPLDLDCFYSYSKLSYGRHLITITVTPGASFILNTAFDIDTDASSVMLLKADMPNQSIFDTYKFDVQDNWPTVPATYTTVTKTGHTFTDVSTLSVTDLYKTETFSFNTRTMYLNRILYSNIFNNLFIVKRDGTVNILRCHERFDVTLAASGTQTFTIMDPLYRTYRIYQIKDGVYSDATTYTLSYTNDSVTLKNTSSANVTFAVIVL